MRMRCNFFISHHLNAWSSNSIFVLSFLASSLLQLFRYVEQAEWATEVMKATGKPVAVCLSVSLAGDMTGVLPSECAVRVARAGE